MPKIVETRKSPYNTIKDTSTIMRNPLSELCREDCASILDSIVRGFPCFHDFWHGASLHPYSFNFTTYFSWFAYKRSYNTQLRVRV